MARFEMHLRVRILNYEKDLKVNIWDIRKLAIRAVKLIRLIFGLWIFIKQVAAHLSFVDFHSVWWMLLTFTPIKYLLILV